MSLYNMGVHFGRAISFASGAMVAAPQTATGSVFHRFAIQMPIEFLRRHKKSWVEFDFIRHWRLRRAIIKRRHGDGIRRGRVDGEYWFGLARIV